MVERFSGSMSALDESESGWLVRYSDYADLKAENERLTKINAALMGDDEDAPRYTTKRLKQEIAKAVERALAERAGGVKALHDIKDAILRADPKVLVDTLWMPDDTFKGGTVVDYIDHCLTTEPAAPLPRDTSRFDRLSGVDDDQAEPEALRKWREDQIERVRDGSFLTRPAEQAVTEAMVLAGCRAILPGLFRHGLAPLETDGPGARRQIADTEKQVRRIIEAAMEAGR